MTFEITYNPENEDQIEKLNEFLEKTFCNPINPLLGPGEYDRLVELYETLEPIAVISPSWGMGCDIKIFKIDEGNGEFHQWHEDSGEITWVEPDDENNLSVESIIASLNQIL